MKSGDTPTLTIVFTEAVASFASGDDVTCATGSLASMSSSDDITWTGTFTPPANTEDSSNICSVATSYTDAYGNGVGEAQDTANYEVETQAPSVTSITFADTTLIEGETSLVTIVFSEAVAAFTNADFTIVNGALSTVADSGDATTWTATYTPTAETSDTTNVLTIGTGYTDTYGNDGASGTSANYIVDGVDPEITSVSFDDTAMKSGDTPTLTIVFTEAVASFASGDDVTCATGSLASMSSSDDITWTGTFTPPANTEDSSNICSVATSYTDAYGNGVGEAQDTANYEVETQAPSVTSITFADTTLIEGETSLVTIVFSEAVAAFTNADFTIVNGALSTVADSGDATTWTATYTPTAETSDTTNVLTIGTGYTDTYGNDGASGTSANYIVDGVDPEITSVSMGDSDLLKGETTTLTIVFTEAVAAFDSGDDVTCGSGSLAAMTSSDDITWTGTFTPTANTEDDSNTCAVGTGYTDAYGNGVGEAQSTANYEVETQAPSVTSITFAAVSYTHLTLPTTPYV